MVVRQLVFYRWSSINTKPPFEYHHALTELNDKIAGDADFAVMANDEVTTALTVVASGTERQPAKLQLLALRGEQTARPSGNRARSWRRWPCRTTGIRPTSPTS